MHITNKFGIPQPLVNAMARDNYSRGEAHKSITQLIGPPQIDILRECHHADIETDAADNLWLLLGRAMHHIAEHGADEHHIAEERLVAPLKGWLISGAMDLQHMDNGGIVITDYKFTSVWAALSDRPEWEAQLNCYAWLARTVKNYRIERLVICAILRDWRSFEKARRKDYPPVPIITIEIPLWTYKEQQQYLEKRIKHHQDAWRCAEWGEDLPQCSDKDRWFRNGKYIRCERYCPVSKWCKQNGLQQ